jgi:hypothetical protein
MLGKLHSRLTQIHASEWGVLITMQCGIQSFLLNKKTAAFIEMQVFLLDSFERPPSPLLRPTPHEVNTLIDSWQR